MHFWRLFVVLALVFLLGVPLALPLVQTFTEPEAWRGLEDGQRLLSLARNTILLVGGTLLLTLPPGIIAAVFLYRTNLPFRHVIRFLVLLTLFIPLPLFASGWQTVLGSGGWLPTSWWNVAQTLGPGQSAPPIWTPWGRGLASAIWIHAVAGLPWVILIVGQGLCWVERELEEDALTVAGPMRVLWHVTLPRARAAIGVAALWVGLQAATEITVTDVMQIRTFAEEVYTQFVLPDPTGGTADPLTRAVVVGLPGMTLLAGLVLWIVPRWERTLPPLEGLSAAPLLFSLHRARGPLLGLVVLLGGGLLAVPLLGLLWRTGLHGAPPHWTLEQSPGLTLVYLREALQSWGKMIVGSLVVAGLAGMLAGALALLTCWCALGSWWMRMGTLLVLTASWAIPGPVIGLGLKDTIKYLLDLSELLAPDSPSTQLLGRLLYHGPSLAPVLWIDLIRFFPYAVAILWPIVRLIPRELREAVRLDGASPSQQLAHLIWPMTSGACLRAFLVVAILSLGELSAGKLVATPGAPTYSMELFTQMHYGVTNGLAARCLVLLGMVTLLASLFQMVNSLRTKGEG